LKQINQTFDKPTFLFHEDCPSGEMFTACDVEQKLEEGWVDTPARLKLPENGDIETGITEESVKEASAQDIVKACEAMGFIVLTPEQMKAEAVKMAEIAFNAENLRDETVIAEFERRFGNDKVEVIDHEDVQDEETEQAENEPEDFSVKLLAQFNEKPEALNKDELLVLGNGKFDLGLRSNMKEATMIARITAALNEE